MRAPGEWTLHPANWSAASVPQPGDAPPSADAAVTGKAINRILVETPAGPEVRSRTARAPRRPGHAASPRAAEYAFMYVLDINGDGRNDVLTSMAHSYGVLWFEQREDGQWRARSIDATWANAHSTAMADMNGDGQPDLDRGEALLRPERHRRRRARADGHLLVRIPARAQGHRRVDPPHRRLRRPRRRRTSDGGRRTWTATATATSSRRGRPGLFLSENLTRRSP